MKGLFCQFYDVKFAAEIFTNYSDSVARYCRAQGCDFESWNTEGWGQKDLLPFMKQV